MEYRQLGQYVSLNQGLAINAGTAHLVSKTKNDEFVYPLLRIADMVSGEYEKYISCKVNPSVIAQKDDIIYTRTGQVGLVFRGYYGVVHNNSFIVSLQSDNLSKDYLYAVLNSDFTRPEGIEYPGYLIKKGQQGEMVRLIQERLIELGYSCGSCGADSIFGRSTFNAICVFQKDNGLSADGICGPLTWEKLF